MFEMLLQIITILPLLFDGFRHADALPPRQHAADACYAIIYAYEPMLVFFAMLSCHERFIDAALILMIAPRRFDAIRCAILMIASRQRYAMPRRCFTLVTPFHAVF